MRGCGRHGQHARAEAHLTACELAAASQSSASARQRIGSGTCQYSSAASHAPISAASACSDVATCCAQMPFGRLGRVCGRPIRRGTIPYQLPCRQGCSPPATGTPVSVRLVAETAVILPRGARGSRGIGSKRCARTSVPSICAREKGGWGGGGGVAC